jgi:5'-AMP-activated protein kinase regulatory beta subunit
MGNAPPSNGNTRENPQGVPGVMGTNGHHPHHGGPYTNGVGGVNSPHNKQQQHHQHSNSHQQQQNSQHSQQSRHSQQPNQYGGGYNNSLPDSNSDASMSNVEDSSNQNNRMSGGPGAGQGGNNNANETGGQQSSSKQSLELNLASLAAADDDTVPTVFRWEHGGRQVYITGTFNGWSRQIPMHRSGNDFTYIHNLKRGKHAFKFIVDDEWRFAPDQPTVADIEGRINNFIDVTDFKAYTGDKDFEREKAAAYYSVKRSAPNQDGSDVGGNGAAGADGSAAAPDPFTDPDGEVFTHNMPDLDEYTKDPPPLPPHLRHIILNKPPQLSDTAALPVPQHVALNHLYCTAIKDNMMVLGITQRFRTKFVTTVYYSPELNKT